MTRWLRIGMLSSICLAARGRLGSFVDDEGKEFLAYPNPTNGVLKLRLPDSEEVQIEVMDISGKVVWTELPIKNDTEINLGSLTSGIYYVHVTTSTGLLKKIKVVKN